MLRITTPSPSSRPSTSLGSTRESTQPSTCRVSLVGNARPANAPVAANAALRRTSSSEEMAMSAVVPVPPRLSLHLGVSGRDACGYLASGQLSYDRGECVCEVGAEDEVREAHLLPPALDF